MRHAAKLALVVAIGLVLLALAAHNADRTVTIALGSGRVLADLPLALVIAAATSAGVLLAVLVSAVDQVRGRLEIRGLRREVAGLRAELRQLRNLPVEAGLERGRQP